MPIAEITRAETVERSRLLRVNGYEVTLDLTRGGEVFGSTSVIRFGCTEPGPASASYADLIAETVHEIVLNGQRIDPAAAYDQGRITLTNLAAENELRVVAECRYSRDGTGLHRAVDPADQRVYTYTKFEPAYARAVYANFEQPDLKASFLVSVIVPAHWTVLSNEPVLAASPVAAAEPGAEATAMTWRFEPSPALPTYLVAVAAGEYHVMRTSHTTPGGQVISLGLACRASLARYLDADEILDITRAGLDYYTRLFETEYPFAKYDQVFVPEYSVGATENAGCVVLTDQLLFRSQVTDGMHQLRAGVILHEMAHMWFGDLVTMKWWDDLWLNESFAEFAAVQASAEATRYEDAWAVFAGSRKAWGYGQDQLPSTHPVAADVGTLTEAIANFDGISYAKGASVLRQLVARLGRGAFLAGIRAYFGEYRWANATLADWLAALEASSGVSLAAWAKAWLQTAGPSTLRCDVTVDDDGAFTSFAVLQQAAGGPVALRPHRIAIGLYRRGEDGVLARVAQVPADIDGPRTVIGQLRGHQQPDLVLLNDDDLTYAVLRFDERSLRTLTTSIGQLADPLARAVCWTSVADMVWQAELAVPEFVSMVARAVASEPSVTATAGLLETCWQVMRTLAGPAQFDAASRRLAETGARLLSAAEPGSDHQLVWAQLLSWAATAPDQVDLIAGLLDGSAVPAGLTVGSELRWALLRRLAATGRAGDPEIDAELARDSTDAGARSAAACRAAIGDAAHKEAAWRLLTDPAGISSDLLRSVAVAFYQPSQAALLAPYARRYFDELPALWEGSGGHMRVARSNALFPVTAASAELIDRIDTFLSVQPRDRGLVRVLTEQRHRVRRALASQAL